MFPWSATVGDIITCVTIMVTALFVVAFIYHYLRNTFRFFILIYKVYNHYGIGNPGVVRHPLHWRSFKWIFWTKGFELALLATDDWQDKAFFFSDTKAYVRGELVEGSDLTVRKS